MTDQVQVVLLRFYILYEMEPQGQYWAGRAPPPYKAPPYMAAANFVVITNREGCALNGTAAIDQ